MKRLAIVAALLFVQPAWALPEKFTDKEDGSFDLSDYLLLHRGALPVPIVITEPAVGYGGGLALAYFSQSFAEQAEKARAAGEPAGEPATSIRPPLGRTRPHAILTSVDLPAPFGPSSPTISPSPTATSTPTSACFVP